MEADLKNAVWEKVNHRNNGRTQKWKLRQTSEFNFLLKSVIYYGWPLCFCFCFHFCFYFGGFLSIQCLKGANRQDEDQLHALIVIGRKESGLRLGENSLCKRWWVTGAGRSGKLWMPHHWKCSRPGWMGLPKGLETHRSHLSKILNSSKKIPDIGC